MGLGFESQGDHWRNLKPARRAGFLFLVYLLVYQSADSLFRFTWFYADWLVYTNIAFYFTNYVIPR